MTRELQTFREFENSAIGFNDIFDRLNRSFANSASTGYPPYNIIQQDEDNYIIELALAGFGKDDLTIELDKNVLTIVGYTSESKHSADTYLHKGISNRRFQREFALGEHVEVIDVALRDGLLIVKLERVVPESAKPKQISIS